MVHTCTDPDIRAYVRTYTVYTQATWHWYLHKCGYCGWGAATTTAVSYALLRGLVPFPNTSSLVQRPHSLLTSLQDRKKEMFWKNLSTWLLCSTTKWWCSTSCALRHAASDVDTYPHLSLREKAVQHTYVCTTRHWSTATTWHNTEWMNTDSSLYAQFGS